MCRLDGEEARHLHLASHHTRTSWCHPAREPAGSPPAGVSRSHSGPSSRKPARLFLVQAATMVSEAWCHRSKGHQTCRPKTPNMRPLPVPMGWGPEQLSSGQGRGQLGVRWLTRPLSPVDPSVVSSRHVSQRSRRRWPWLHHPPWCSRREQGHWRWVCGTVNDLTPNFCCLTLPTPF